MLLKSDTVHNAWAATQRAVGIKLTIEGTEYDASDITSLTFDSGAMNGEALALGSTYQNTIKVVFSNLIEGLALTDEITPELGIELPDGTWDYTPLGVFVIDAEVQQDRNNNTTTVSASDRMCMLGGTYESKLTYPAAINDIAVEIANLAAVKINEDDFARLPTDKVASFGKVTYRDAIGFVAQFAGGFATFDRDGLLDIRQLVDPNFDVAPSQYQSKGLTKNEALYRVGGIACTVTTTTTDDSGNETQDTTTLQSGSTAGTQITISNPGMTQDLLDGLYEQLQDLNFYPFSLSWFGDPNLEAGDWIEVQDTAGNTFKTPNLLYSLTFSGGITATSKADTTVSASANFVYKGQLHQIVDNIRQYLNAAGQQVSEGIDEPLHPKAGDVWFKKSGPDTYIMMYKIDPETGIGSWIEEVSTKGVSGLDAELKAAEAKLNVDILAAQANLTTAQKDVAALQTKLAANDVTQAQLSKDLSANSTTLAQAQADLATNTKDLAALNLKLKANDDTQAQLQADLAANTKVQAQLTTDLSDNVKLVNANKQSVDATLATVNKTLTQAQTDTATAVKNADLAVANAQSAVDASGLATKTAQAASDAATAAQALATQVSSDFAGVQSQAAAAVGSASDALAQAKSALATAGTAQADAASAIAQAQSALSTAGQAQTGVTKVSALYDSLNGTLTASIQTVQNGLDNLQIGSRNLLSGTGFFTNADQARVLSETFQGHAILVNDKVGGNAGSYLDPIRVLMTITPLSEYYTLSFWAKADVDKTPSRAYFYQPNTTILSTNSQGYTTNGSDGNSIFSLTTEWTYYWVTWKQTPADVPKSIIFGRHMSDSPGKSYYSMPMLVEGNKPATWQPAPEDVQQQITTNTTNITANSKLIALAATQQTVNHLSQTVDTNTAQLKLTATEADLEATSKLVDTLNQTVTDQATKLALTATEADLTAEKQVVDNLGGTVAKNTDAIKVNADAIVLKADQSVVDTIGQQVTTNTAALKLTATGAQFDALSKTVNTLDGTVQQQAFSIQANADALKSTLTSTDVTGMLAPYATQIWTQSQVMQKANEWSTQLSSVQSTIDNLGVGGENLLTGTADFAGWSVNLKNGRSIDTTVYPNVYHFAKQTTTGDTDFLSRKLPQLKPNTDYEFSFVAHGSGILTTYLYPSLISYSDGYHIWTLTDSDQVFIQHFTTASTMGDANTVLFRNHGSVTSSGSNTLEAYISKMQIKEGKVVTDWSPASQDATTYTDQKAAALSLTIDQYQQQITAVKTTADTATTNLQAVTNTANSTSTLLATVQTDMKAIRQAGANLVYNSNAELGLDGWTASRTALFGTGTHVYWYNCQKQFLEIHTNDTGTGENYIVSKQIPVKSNTTYHLHFWWVAPGNILSIDVLQGVHAEDYLKQDWKPTTDHGEFDQDFNTGSRSSINVRIDINGSNNGKSCWLGLAEICLTEGAGKVPWTPCADDSALVTAFNSVKSTVDGTVQSIGNINDQLVTINSNVHGVQTTVASKADQTQVTQISDQLTSVVGSMSNPNLILNSGLPTDTSGWLDATNLNIVRHAFYKDNTSTLFEISNATTTEVTASTNRFKVARNSKYTISFKGFSSSNVISSDVMFLGRPEGSTDARGYTDAVKIQYDMRFSPAAVEYRTYTWTTGEVDEGYIRFDNNGSNNGNNSAMFFAEIKVEAGEIATPWEYDQSYSQTVQMKSLIDDRVIVDGKIAAALSLSADGGGTVTIRGASLYVTAASHFDDASIQSAAIANLDAAKITSGSISSDRLATTKLNADNITSGSISADRLATTKLNASNITSGSINAGLITTGVLSADMILGGTFDASKMTVKNIDAGSITSGSIATALLASTKINADNITSGSIAAERIATTALSATNITSGTLDVGKLTVKNLSADLIATGTLDASNLTVKNLSASSIIGGTFDGLLMKVQNIDASSINTGTLNAANLNVIGLNASAITTGTIKGANLAINLNSGEVLFTKGSIKSTTGTLDIEIEDGTFSQRNSSGAGFLMSQGNLYFSATSFWDALDKNEYALSTLIPDYGYLGFGDMIATKRGMALYGKDSLSLGLIDTSLSVDYFDNAQGFISIKKDDSMTVHGGGKGLILVGGTTKTGTTMPTSPSILVGSNASGDGGGNRIYIDAEYFHVPTSYSHTSSGSANVIVKSDGALVRTSSATKYKTNINRFNSTDMAEKLLSLPQAHWYNKQDMQRYVDDPQHYQMPEFDYGMIAEDLASAGLEDLVVRGDDGELEDIRYDRIAPALLPLLAKMKREIEELKGEKSA